MFRSAYPTFLKVCAALLLILVAADMWLVYRRVTYLREIDQMREGMTVAERQRSDLIVRSEQDKLQMAVELLKRQARWAPELHLSVAVDSGHMYLERNGALLRDMLVTVGTSPAPVGGTDSTASSATVLPLVPRGTRTVDEVRTTDTLAMILAGGSRIYASDDTTPVTPGDIRVRAADFRAMLPNLGAGMTVYFY